MNLLIKAECEVCGHTIQFLPKEGAEGTYENTCGACENGLSATVAIAPLGGPVTAKATTTAPKTSSTSGSTAGATT